MALQFFSKKAPQRLAHFFFELGWIGAGFPVDAAQSFENYFFGVSLKLLRFPPRA